GPGDYAGGLPPPCPLVRRKVRGRSLRPPALAPPSPPDVVLVLVQRSDGPSLPAVAAAWPQSDAVAPVARQPAAATGPLELRLVAAFPRQLGRSHPPARGHVLPPSRVRPCFLLERLVQLRGGRLKALTGVHAGECPVVDRQCSTNDNSPRPNRPS